MRIPRRPKWNRNMTKEELTSLENVFKYFIYEYVFI
jgi:hypothetical protein